MNPHDRQPRSDAPAGRSRQANPLPLTFHATLPADPDAIYVVGRGDAARVPDVLRERATREGVPIMACPAFAAATTAHRASGIEGGCERGERCPFAHIAIDVGAGPQFRQHRAPPGGWPSLAAVPYERFPPAHGTTATVPDAGTTTVSTFPAVVFPMQAPNAAGRVVETLRPEECLLTRALEGNTTGTFTHCAHWLLKGSCHHGAACKFVHAALPSELARAAVATRAKRRPDGGASKSKITATLDHRTQDAPAPGPSAPEPPKPVGE
eukprot:CAMPEP_0174829450 /NCGR_PEP_ID=MMETSP1114-20130205/1934_1 /TAXON_ID=312471 /ORGANISM="Neobodo designis, Strain CCAP 1951/1" /LENGTH=266 /DNA_ID=CAMNT_0016063199 /DNA_START=221 /DNA_END=1021 /DNA_ORIENTATION=-